MTIRADRGSREDRQLLQYLDSASPVGFFRTDASGVCTWVNQTCCQLLGLPMTEMLGDGWLVGVHVDDRKRVAASWSKAVRDSRRYREQYRTRNSREGITWVLAEGRAIEDDTGQIAGWIGTVTDITDNKRNEEIVRGRHRVLERLARGAPLEEILRLLAEQAEALFPKLRCSILEYDERDRRLRHGAAPSLPREYVEAVDGVEIGPDVGSCGAAVYRRARVVIPDVLDHPNWAPFRQLAVLAGFRATWSEPVFSSTGDVLGAFAMYSDEPGDRPPFEFEFIEGSAHLAGIAIEHFRGVDERLELEMRVQRRQKLESLGVLAGGIAHDFNNLLVSIVGNAARVAAKLPADDVLSKSVRQIQVASDRATDLTRQILTYAGRARPEIRRFDVGEEIDAIAELLRTSVPRKIGLEIVPSPGLPKVEADVSQIHQVVLNLVANAAEAINDAPGRIELRVSQVELERADLDAMELGVHAVPGSFVKIEVADTGCGMEPETKARMFDPFFTTKFTGRGLGLSMLHGIARSHRGAVGVQSAPGRGTVVRLLLPAADSIGATDSASGLTSMFRDPGGTVLIVDDEPLVLDYVEMVLGDEGIGTLRAYNGRQAVETFREHADEIGGVVLDVMMPEMNGVEVMREIYSVRPDVRVLLTSGFHEKSVADELASDEEYAFLQKPFKPDKLLAAVRRLIGG